MKSARLMPFALFLLALLIRCIGLQWGLPSSARWYSYHPDEYQMFSAVVNLISHGDFNPRFFNYPSLYVYLAYFAHGAMAAFGLAHPLPENQSQLWMLTRDVLLSARVVTAIVGAATVPLVFLIARQIGGFRVGVLGALLLTFAPGHVQHSHFATVDVPTTFFVALCLWLSTRALHGEANLKHQRVSLLLAALVAGLAAATKYNGVLVLVAPLADCIVPARIFHRLPVCSFRFSAFLGRWKKQRLCL
jgi:4-amino-4-deoxy-L-arabinose transferase-like glycosyltransferase